MKKLFIALFSVAFTMTPLSTYGYIFSSEPEYKTEKEYLEKSNSDSEKLCFMACENAMIKCNSANQKIEQKISNCSSDYGGDIQDRINQNPQDIFGNIAYSLLMRTTGHYACSEEYEDCVKPYEECFTSCGGVIKTNQICISNCDVEQVISRQKADQLTQNNNLIGVLRDYLGGSENVYFSPDIPARKIKGYLKKMSQLADDGDVLLALVDTTLFGSSDEGYAFFGSYFIYRTALSDPIRFEYEDLPMNITHQLKNGDVEPFILVGNDELFIWSGAAYNMANLLSNIRDSFR